MNLPEKGKLYQVLMDRAFFKNKAMSEVMLCHTILKDSIVFVAASDLQEGIAINFVRLHIIFGEYIGWIRIPFQWAYYMILQEEDENEVA